MLRGGLQFQYGLLAIHCSGSRLLRQLLARRAEHQRHVHVARRRQPQGTLQENLARRVIEQISAANHVGDPLLGVVDDHRQLIGP